MIGLWFLVFSVIFFISSLVALHEDKLYSAILLGILTIIFSLLSLA